MLFTVLRNAVCLALLFHICQAKHKKVKNAAGESWLEALPSAHADAFIRALLNEEALQRHAFSGLVDGANATTVGANLRGLVGYLNALVDPEVMPSVSWDYEHILERATQTMVETGVANGKDQVQMTLTLLYEFGEQLAAKLVDARQQQRHSLATRKSALLGANVHESRPEFERLLGRLVARASTLNIAA